MEGWRRGTDSRDIIVDTTDQNKGGFSTEMLATNTSTSHPSKARGYTIHLFVILRSRNSVPVRWWTQQVLPEKVKLTRGLPSDPFTSKLLSFLLAYVRSQPLWYIHRENAAKF